MGFLFWRSLSPCRVTRLSTIRRWRTECSTCSKAQIFFLLARRTCGATTNSSRLTQVAFVEEAGQVSEIAVNKRCESESHHDSLYPCGSTASPAEAPLGRVAGDLVQRAWAAVPGLATNFTLTVGRSARAISTSREIATTSQECRGTETLPSSEPALVGYKHSQLSRLVRKAEFGDGRQC